MIIIGVDPGSRKTGYGIIERKGNRLSVRDYGTIAPPPTRAVGQRLEQIYNGLYEVVSRSQAEEAALEEVFFSKNAKSALVLGQARGVALLALQKAGIRTFEYSARKVKQGVTGRGTASKEQVQFMIKKLLGIREEKIPEDAADALAIALCHSHTFSFRSKLKA